MIILRINTLFNNELFNQCYLVHVATCEPQDDNYRRRGGGVRLVNQAFINYVDKVTKK